MTEGGMERRMEGDEGRGRRDGMAALSVAEQQGCGWRDGGMGFDRLPFTI